MRAPEPDFAAILRALLRRQVDFIVVGGVCAALHGAPVTTFDLDVVHSRKPENIRRLLAALKALDAFYRAQPEKRRRRRRSHLSAPGHQLLMTRFGPLDLLGTIGRGLAYAELLEETTEMAIGRGLRVRVLRLRKLIEIKEETADDKDKAVLPLLRRTLEEEERRRG